MTNRTMIFAALCAMTLAACATGPRPGNVEGPNAPQLVSENGVAHWTNIDQFGPVPADAKARGDATCAALNTDKLKFAAIGYHSKAQDASGNVFPNGGFYCQAQ